MAFRDKLDALKANLASESQRRQAIEALIAAEQENRPPKVDEIAPVFALPDATGTSVSSATLLRQGPLILTFYRGLWCPYCQRDLHALEENLAGHPFRRSFRGGDLAPICTGRQPHLAACPGDRLPGA